jgi:hypothetical protein
MTLRLRYTDDVFVKEIVKKNSTSDKAFIYHRLMESVRTPRGPRHRKILNLGKLLLAKEDWKTLANRTREIITGQESFLIPPPHIESLAQHYTLLLRQKEMKSIPIPQESDWETIDLNSLSQSESRTIGAESVGYEAFKRLGFPQMLSRLGFKEEQIHKVALLVIGRLVHPASERETTLWGKKISALPELLGADFEHLSNNALYRTSDQLVKHSHEIEKGLAERERNLFHLGEKIILYDLTNTYLAGSGRKSHKARRGRSKQKRNDCPFPTLALVFG